MTTSGTTTFNPDVGELMEEAFERAGLESRTGYDIRSARRSLNFLMAEWANKGLNLWTVQTGTITCIPGQKEYNLPTDCVDIIEHVRRTTINGQSTDLTMSRISVSSYAQIVNKDNSGPPIQIYVARKINPTITLWPVPDSATTYTIVFWYMKRGDDAGRSNALTMEIPFRFYNALVSGLAYNIALKHPEVADRLDLLKGLYDEAFALAAEEDRDRASIRLVPFMGYQL